MAQAQGVSRQRVPLHVTCLVLLTVLPLTPRDDATCSLQSADRFQYWRRISLDLRQRTPDPAEYQALREVPDVPAEMLDQLLQGDELREFVRAYHAELLWPALGPHVLFSAVNRLEEVADDPGERLFIRQSSRSGVYRPQPGTPCADRKQTAFDADGTPLPGSDGLDGWVEVEPYWAPGTTVRVCAFEAQSRLSVPRATGGTIDCRLPSSYAERRCGCGPHLDLCSTQETQPHVTAALQEQLLRFVERVVQEDRPYTEILTSAEMDVNGPAAHFLRWQWAFGNDLFLAPEGDAALPALGFQDETTWQTVQRRGLQAGVLTLPVYLLHFGTNRARAHRFHDAFLCEPFEPPPGGLRLEPDHEPNVAKKPGCSYCHQVLEPAAAHWGRFAEQGTAWLDPLQYPVDLDACRTRQWGSDPLLKTACLRLYLTEREPRGRLRAYEFADDTPEGQTLRRNIEAGPRAFADEAIADGRFARCTVRRLWTRLLHREPSAQEIAFTLPRLTDQFAQDGYRIRPLLKAIVQEPAYRSVRPDEAP